MGSNFAIYKAGDELIFRYDSGIAAGNVITWVDGFIMDASGQIGIGASPAHPLDVTGNVNTSLAYLIGGVEVLEMSGNVLEIGANVGVGGITFYSGGGTLAGRIDGGQRWGVGQTPANEQLEVAGAIKITAAAATAAGTVQYSGGRFQGHNATAWVNLDEVGTVTGSGADNQIAVWTGASDIEGTTELTYDAGSLSVLAAADPTVKLATTGASTSFLTITNSSAWSILVPTANSRVSRPRPCWEREVISTKPSRPLISSS